jgi:hypothetical protein
VGREVSLYSTYFCGGQNVCSGCESFVHGVYEDGSGDPVAMDAMKRAGYEVRDGRVRPIRRKSGPVVESP